MRGKSRILPIHNLENPPMERKSSRKLFEILKAWLPNLGKRSRILDAGCGGGIFGCLLKKELGAQVFGVDITDEALKLAQRRGLEVKKGDLGGEIPFKDQSFDLIVCRQVLEHLFDPDQGLDELHRLLKRGGSLIITTPNLAAWYNRLFLLLGIQPFFLETSTRDKTVGLSFTRQLTAHRQPVGHLRVYTPGALKDILCLHKFEFKKLVALAVPYFPWYISIVDRIFAHISFLGSDLVVWAVKK